MAETPPEWLLEILTPGALEAIVRAIAAAEAHTSGEIRVHLDPRCADDPLHRARTVFATLGMQRTAGRNAVLIYVSVEDRRLAVIGDVGVAEQVPSAFWTQRCDDLAAHLRAGRAADGLIATIHAVGDALRRSFPRTPDDRNEFPDDISTRDPD
jgi:uncharacterized membrane protein